MRVWHAPGILWGNFTPQNCATTNREAWFFRGLVGVGQNQDFQDELVGSGQESVTSGKVLSLSCLNRGFSRIFAEDADCFISGGTLSESGFSGLEDGQDNVCKNIDFHGGFTEVFMSIGGPWVPRIQYTLPP